MSGFITFQTSGAPSCTGSLRAAPAHGWRGIIAVVAFLGGLRMGSAQTVAEGKTTGLTETEATVSYVSEVPWQWNGEEGNPLELWARKLSMEWARAPGEVEERLANLRPELSWERLAITSRTKKAGAFVVQGYELIESGDAAELDGLLVPSRNGRAAFTEFVILRQRRTRASGDERKFSMLDLWKKQILVDRGGCGELVYRWLDRENRPGTGATSRAREAEYRSATSAAEAVLAVYFGEVDACVVCRSSYTQVLTTNPNGLAARLEEAKVSPPLLKHVIACPRSMPSKRRLELVKNAKEIRMQLADGEWQLTVPKPEDFKELRQLIGDWQKYFGNDKESDPDSAPPTPPASAAQTAVPAEQLQKGECR